MKPLQKLYACLFLTVVALPFALTGCEDKLGGSCDWRPAGADRCFEYSSGEMKSGKEICKNGRVWSDKECAHADAIVGCKASSGVKKWLFATGGGTKEKALAECSSDPVGPDGKPLK